MKDNKLKTLRKKIDTIDRKIASLYIKRKEAVKEIGKYKKKNDIKVFDKVREEEIYKKIKKSAKKIDDKNELISIYKIILKASKKVQSKV